MEKYIRTHNIVGPLVIVVVSNNNYNMIEGK